jgi:hypothetical protein
VLKNSVRTEVAETERVSAGREFRISIGIWTRNPSSEYFDPTGKSHAHLQPDLKKYFPTKIRVTIIQISKGAIYNPSKVPGPAEKEHESDGAQYLRGKRR